VTPPPRVEPPKSAPPKATPTPAPVVPSGPLVPTIGSPFALQGPDIVQVPPEARATTYLRCLLGMYRQHYTNTRHPFAFLGMPTGNVVAPEVAAVLKDRVNLTNVGYLATAKFYAPEEGIYFTTARNASIAIDGLPTTSGRIRLARGIHRFQCSSSNYGQPNLRTASVGLFRDESQLRPIPLWNSAAEIDEFFAAMPEGQPVTELSNWRPTSDKLIADVPPDAQPAPIGFAAFPNPPFVSLFDSDAPDVVKVPAERRADTYFRCLLGSYSAHYTNAPHPFAFLSTPRGNLYSEEMQFALRGRITMRDLHFKASAKVRIPQDGEYVVDTKVAGLRIDGQPVKGGKAVLKAGLHSVEFSCSDYGQPNLRQGSAAMWTDETRTVEVPFVNTAADIDRFLSQKVDGQTMLEVSGWRPTRDNLVE
jgi:hypothetical protein